MSFQPPPPPSSTTTAPTAFPSRPWFRLASQLRMEAQQSQPEPQPQPRPLGGVRVGPPFVPSVPPPVSTRPQPEQPPRVTEPPPPFSLPPARIPSPAQNQSSPHRPMVVEAPTLKPANGAPPEPPEVVVKPSTPSTPPQRWQREQTPPPLPPQRIDFVRQLDNGKGGERRGGNFTPPPSPPPPPPPHNIPPSSPLKNNHPEPEPTPFALLTKKPLSENNNSPSLTPSPHRKGDDKSAAAKHAPSRKKKEEDAGAVAGMGVLTIAGENIGAYMETGRRSGSSLKQQQPFSGRSYQVSPKDGRVENEKYDNGTTRKEEGQKPAAAAMGRPMAAVVNSNVQGVNNSIIFHGSCSHVSPGVHIALSSSKSQRRTATGHKLTPSSGGGNGFK